MYLYDKQLTIEDFQKICEESLKEIQESNKNKNYFTFTVFFNSIEQMINYADSFDKAVLNQLHSLEVSNEIAKLTKKFNT